MPPTDSDGIQFKPTGSTVNFTGSFSIHDVETDKVSTITVVALTGRAEVSP